MNTEDQPPLSGTPSLSKAPSSRKSQALLGVVVLLTGMVILGIPLVAAIGGAIAGGCCGGHGGGSSGGSSSWSFWNGIGFVTCGFGLVLLLGAALERTLTLALVYFCAVALFMGLSAVSNRLQEHDTMHETERAAAALARWKTSHQKHLAAIREAIEADDPAALETADTTCQAFVNAIPPAQMNEFSCGIAPLDSPDRLHTAFKANRWRILDHLLDRTQQYVKRKQAWHGRRIDATYATCFVGLAEHDDDATWLMSVQDQSKISALRETGEIAPPQGPVPIEMLTVLAKHRGPPLRAGDEALYHLFVRALAQRRMDLVETISAQVNGRFEWCSPGMREMAMVNAIRPSSNGQVWKDGEATLFRAIASWPQEAWRGVANTYLLEIARSNAPSQAGALASCKSAAGRIAATRSDTTDPPLAETCGTF
ncbi:MULTISPECIES: hypothetical protein [unclassified Variovorax]|uniref:hypothetical protein n=1 Tax=unclassified Variovorax TaxID=663243 RepID=UPI0034E98A3C